MFMLIGLGLDVIILLMLFGVMSKLDELGREVKALREKQPDTPAPAAPLPLPEG